jgi:hypothetical protein
VSKEATHCRVRGSHTRDIEDGYLIRRTAVDFNVALISNMKSASALPAKSSAPSLYPLTPILDCTVLLVSALERVPDIYAHSIKSWQEYMADSLIQQ